MSKPHTSRRRAQQVEEPAQTTVVPPWSPLKDPLGDDLPYYGSEKPFPPPLPLLDGSTTGRLRAAGNRPSYQRPRYIPFEAPARAIVDRESVVRRPIDESSTASLSSKPPGELLRAYYKRPSWVWAAVGVVGLFVGSLVYKRSSFSSLGKDSITQQREEIRELAKVVAAEKELQGAATEGSTGSDMAKGDLDSVTRSLARLPSREVEAAVVVNVIPVEDAGHSARGGHLRHTGPVVDSTSVPPSEHK